MKKREFQGMVMRAIDGKAVCEAIIKNGKIIKVKQ